MTAEDRFNLVRELFEIAGDLQGHERDAFLVKECGGDQGIYDEVKALLAADERAGSFLEKPLVTPQPAKDLLVGSTIGQYRVVDVLAAGGMGVVYRAEQSQPRRLVALKLIRSDVVAPQLLRRFELEAEVLGRLNHPGIAQVLEASTTETAHGTQPFFAMELVEGPQLIRSADDRNLDIHERVELLVKVCEAVHHAHQNGVIHRDLKPANILVGGDGQPKVLDFGVARVTDADLQATTLNTDSGLIIGTLQYMSPEQVGGRHDELDIRSDIYALGVIGYQLFTGRMPLDLSGKSVTEAALAIETAAPAPLSATGASYPADLETIIGTCLEKEKDRRYDSAAALAADLNRFLAHEPIAARPPSVFYQLSRFARRNRTLVAGAILTLLAIVAGLAASTAGWSSATRALSRAETETAKAQRLNLFLAELLQAPDPWADGREVKVVDVLGRASETLDQSLADQPEVAALAHHHLGYTYRDLGQYDEAKVHLSRAAELSAQVPELPATERVLILADLGMVLLDLAELEEAEGFIREAFDTAAARLPEQDPTRIKTWHSLGLLHWEKGELDEAAECLRICLDHSREILGEEHEDTVVTMGALGNVLRQLNRLEEARPFLEQAYASILEQFGSDNPSTAIALNNLAFAYQQLGEHDQALEMFQRSLASRRRVHTDHSQSVIIGLNNVGLQLGMMDRAEEALPYLEEAMEIAPEVVGPDHWMGPALRSTYGRTLLAAGRIADAEREMKASLADLRRILGDDHWRTTTLCSNLAQLYEEKGDPDQAAHYRALAG